jgi:heme a synthase
MAPLRRLAYASFLIACTHLVFGAIVRISGSGMGCGPHWPKCYGYWFPPFDRMDLVIEVLHRYLALLLLASILAVLVAAVIRRETPGVGGRGGVLRAALVAFALGLAAASLGRVTVIFGNAAWATVTHWTVAMGVVAAVTATLIRAGGLGGEVAREIDVSSRAKRASLAGAGLALVTVVMGGLTAKFPGASVACQSFPLCGASPDVERAAVHVQITHRVLAVLVVLHLIGLMIAFRKRREHPLLVRAVTIAASLGVFQLLVAGAMIGMKLPPVLRSLHEATGVSIWISAFVLAYLAQLGRGGHGVREPLVALPVEPLGMSEVAVASVRRAPHSVAVIVARGADL